MKYILYIMFLYSPLYLFSQVGVGTNSPKASLHVEPTSKTNPNGADGVLIPRLADFPGNGVEEGQLIYLKNHATELDGFYFWDGTTWVWLINNYDRTIDRATYIASGTGYTGTGNNRQVNFSRIDAFDTTGFSVAGNNITVGKSGRYLLAFTTSVKRSGTETPLKQANFLYVLFVNNNQLSSITGRVTASTSNEIPSATSAALSTIVDLQVGDVLNVYVYKSNETPNDYSGYGINGLTLTFLR
ncbi:hypothetical protein ACFFU1_04445 [Algibacter miyuki]|uniref:C1q domain-containing protein n=1 Tax=Algibacter miyuki TaxID=1306933 RepID=A0ABV5GXF1_9FLAO|nr:hypothetical protein [Algibacter miyuki]MDN3664552.1 hypothetical protein [Algibacter miyuki]